MSHADEDFAAFVEAEVEAAGHAAEAAAGDAAAAEAEYIAEHCKTVGEMLAEQAKQVPLPTLEVRDEDHYHPNPQDRAAARFWARRLLHERTFVILDTETTGLGGDAEVVQVGLIDPSGVVLMDQLVRPFRGIPPEATAIHGIVDAMVADAPTFGEILPGLLELMGGRRVIAYNAQFDSRLISQSAAARNFSPGSVGLMALRWECAMLYYAQWVGERGHLGYKWQKLPKTHTAHTAIGDCQATLDLIRLMAGVEISAEPLPAAPEPKSDPGVAILAAYREAVLAREAFMAENKAIFDKLDLLDADVAEAEVGLKSHVKTTETTVGDERFECFVRKNYRRWLDPGPLLAAAPWLETVPEVVKHVYRVELDEKAVKSLAKLGRIPSNVMELAEREELLSVAVYLVDKSQGKGKN